MRVLVTGAAGSIGSVVTAGLADLGHHVVAMDRVPFDAPHAAETVVADARDATAMRPAVAGVDGVVHLASIATEVALPDILESHVLTTAVLLDAMVEAGVRRFVFASSNHAVGHTPRTDCLSIDARPRPDSFYGIGKVSAEALGSLYVDRHGIEFVACRIGSFLTEPTSRRHLSTWLSHGDAVRMTAAALTAPDVTFAVLYGISANTRGWWDLAPGHALGYRPEDDAEDYAQQISSTPESDDDHFEASVVGGPFAGRMWTRPAFDEPAADADLLERARRWHTEDPDPDTRAELAAVLEQVDAGDRAARADLAERFDGRLEFGTAGLRGPLGAGPNRMNRAVVIRAAAGLAAYLQEQGGAGGVVVGYDARHKSAEFARDTVAVMRGAGLDAYLLPRALPTPVLAFAIRHLGCAAGVMVTASHNPPQDNGYKVYLGDGSQIVPPADVEISARIDAVAALSDVPLGEGWQQLDDSVVDAYLAAVEALVPSDNPRDLRIVYTPLHGVGREIVERVMADTGFTDGHVVPEQADPDPQFSTVAFPNPEEPGAIDLALALADRVDADIVVANDPDADRCAVAVPGPHGWRMLRGDEVGALLGDDLLRRGEHGVFAASIVSSSLLGAMAARHGQRYEETLTGFKWIARVPGLRYGYEEALGYCVAPDLVRDKDGVSALLLVADLAARLKAEGRTVQNRLDEIAEDYGLYATDQLSVRVSELSLIADAMARLRSAPPTSLGGLRVEQTEDLGAGVGGLPPTEGLRYRLADGARVVVRPSGTEPKLKAYLEVVMPVTDGVDAARIAAVGRLDAMRSDLSAATGLD